MYYRLKSCEKCNGDLVLDGEEWRCLQCARYYYPPRLSERVAVSRMVPDSSGATSGPQAEPAAVGTEKPGRGRGGYTQRADRNVNALIKAKDRSDEHWWVWNQEIIRYLAEGRTVREISLLVGRHERQIRVVRERLDDLRASGESRRPAA